MISQFDLRSTKGRVEYIYSLYPETKDDDQLLLHMYRKIHGIKLSEVASVKRSGRSLRSSEGYVRPSSKLSEDRETQRNIVGVMCNGK